MTALALPSRLPETLEELFQPIRLDTFADLLRAYAAELATMREVAEAVGGKAHVLRHFARGNGVDGAEAVATRLLSLPKAVKALDSHYWSQAMALTDVYDSMPADRKAQWCALVGDLDSVPSFDAPTIQATFSALLADRGKFFAERVDGVFRALSPDHVTNRPQGFRSRLIIARVLETGGGFVYANTGKAEYITDLRRVIAAFAGRGEPDYSTTSDALRWALDTHRGEWVWLDGNSWAIRMYGNGNAHVKLHDEYVWRLNNVLASLYPRALSADALVRPVRRPKDVQLSDSVLDFAVVRALSRAHVNRDPDQPGGWSVWYGAHCGLADHHDRATRNALIAIGGIPAHGSHVDFDYCPSSVIRKICATGMLPDKVLHQFYPTPAPIAARVVELAGIQPGHTVLEPSAGTGSIARYVPQDTQLTCVEIADLHCEVLTSRVRWASVKQGDFLELATQLGSFDRVVMNPPFSAGRWQAHTKAAAHALAPRGVLVAVLPASAAGKVAGLLGPGFAVEDLDCYDDEWPDASVDVVLVRVTRGEL
jgi:phospholipid N-methyltransferase